jgi:hypothetical protein
MERTGNALLRNISAARWGVPYSTSEMRIKRPHLKRTWKNLAILLDVKKRLWGRPGGPVFFMSLISPCRCDPVWLCLGVCLITMEDNACVEQYLWLNDLCWLDKFCSGRRDHLSTELLFDELICPLLCTIDLHHINVSLLVRISSAALPQLSCSDHCSFDCRSGMRGPRGGLPPPISLPYPTHQGAYRSQYHLSCGG